VITSVSTPPDAISGQRASGADAAGRVRGQRRAELDGVAEVAEAPRSGPRPARERRRLRRPDDDQAVAAVALQIVATATSHFGSQHPCRASATPAAPARSGPRLASIEITASQERADVAARMRSR
jgi:hypothetical protein